MKLVEVYRSPRKADTYLYVEQGVEFESLPESLQGVFGAPEHVLSLKLTPDRRLARYSGAEVLEGIASQGYFLQLPPGDRQAEPHADG